MVRRPPASDRPLFARRPDEQIERVAEQDQRDDREMRRGLGIHSSDSSFLLIDQDLILRGTPKASNQAIELSAPQQGVQPRRDHASAAARQLELVLVFPE